VLDRIGAPREEANGAVYAASQLLDLRGMRPGDDVTAWLETEARWRRAPRWAFRCVLKLTVRCWSRAGGWFVDLARTEGEA
jgi:hypothetical protein